LILSPFYQRISTWGGSFSRPVGSILLRGEFSYIPNLLFGTNDPDASSMVTGQNFLNYFIGIDIMVQKARVGFQFAQEKIFGDARLINRTDTDTVATVMIERTFLRDSLQCLIFADREFDQNDLWVRAEIGYRINSRVKCMFGSHSFTGNKTGRLGQFHDWNSFFMKIRYSFSA